MPTIYVLAGTNGAGKSSVAGATIRAKGADYFNPDEATQRFLEADPGSSLQTANSEAWREGVRQLQAAIDADHDYAFETTLGGNTITKLLHDAAQRGVDVIIWYTGLRSVELHIERVRARVARGGHDIPESKIRERYKTSLLNLIDLLPVASEVRVFDNSDDADPATGRPVPRLMLDMRDQRIRASCDLTTAPTWVKPVLAAALKLHRRRRRQP